MACIIKFNNKVFREDQFEEFIKSKIESINNVENTEFDDVESNNTEPNNTGSNNSKSKKNSKSKNNKVSNTNNSGNTNIINTKNYNPKLFNIELYSKDTLDSMSKEELLSFQEAYSTEIQEFKEKHYDKSNTTETNNNLDVNLLKEFIEFKNKDKTNNIKLKGSTKISEQQKEKDQEISNKATQFIGEGSKQSSTEMYRKAWGDKANTGNYTEDDRVFVSLDTESKRKHVTLDTSETLKDNISKAVQAGATIVTNPFVNEGESHVSKVVLSNFLAEKNYVEYPVKSGVWISKKKYKQIFDRVISIKQKSLTSSNNDNTLNPKQEAVLNKLRAMSEEMNNRQYTAEDYKNHKVIGVSSFIQEKEFQENSKAYHATIIGSKVDEIARLFFQNKTPSFEEQTLTDDKTSYDILINNLKLLKNEFNERGEKPFTEEFYVFQDNFNGNDVTLRGKTDLLTIDNNGNIKVYDFKTLTPNALNSYESNKYGQSYVTKHSNQLNAYSIMLRNNGFNASIGGIIRIPLGREINNDFKSDKEVIDSGLDLKEYRDNFKTLPFKESDSFDTTPYYSVEIYDMSHLDKNSIETYSTNEIIHNSLGEFNKLEFDLELQKKNSSFAPKVNMETTMTKPCKLF